MTSVTSFLPRLIQHSLLMISNFFSMKFLFFLNSCLTMCPHHFSKTLLILSFTGSNLWQLPISLPKCSVLSISNSKSPKPRIYSLGTTNLPQVRSCSDLGVIIDDKLTFSNHILSTTIKSLYAICYDVPMFPI